MKRGLKHLVLTAFIVVVVILGSWAVLGNFYNGIGATTANTSNGTNVTMFGFNVTNLSLQGNGTALTSVTINNTGTATGLDITSIVIYNSTSTYVNNSFGSSFPAAGVVVAMNVNITGPVNFTVNFTVNSTATDGATLRANLTANVSQANVSLGVAPGGSGYLSNTTTIDTNPPFVNYVTATPSNDSFNTGSLVVNTTASETVSNLSAVWIAVNGTIVRTCRFTTSNNASNCTYVNSSADNSYLITVAANDTYNHTNLSLSSRIIKIDNTAPSATASCTSSTSAGEPFPCSCSGSDPSGIASQPGSSDSPDGTATPSTAGTFTYTCVVTDNAGNTANNTSSYTITGGSSSSGGGGGGGGGATTTPTASHTFTKVIPGTPATVESFDSDIGVKEIQIEVNNEVQNVKVTVKKYDSKPADVSISKSGDVYQYLQIEVSNLGTSLSQANVQFRVEKSWATANGVDKNNVAVYKFDSAAGKWNEQTTTYASEDATYYYYDVTLTSFSYFAISERALTAGEGTTSTGEEPAVETSSKMKWVWIGLAIVVLFFIWNAMHKRRRPRHK